MASSEVYSQHCQRKWCSKRARPNTSWRQTAFITLSPSAWRGCIGDSIVFCLDSVERVCWQFYRFLLGHSWEGAFRFYCIWKSEHKFLWSYDVNITQVSGLFINIVQSNIYCYLCIGSVNLRNYPFHWILNYLKNKAPMAEYRLTI